MIDSKQLREYVIQPVLSNIGLYSAAAEELLVMTAAAESDGGQYLHQLGKGPAVGIYQMEPETHDDCWNNFLRYKTESTYVSIQEYLSRLGAPTQANLAGKVRSWQIPGVYDDVNYREMAGNMYYATAMCRVKYLRVPKALPAANDIRGLAEYHKTYYNTAGGAAVVDRTIAKYRKYVA